jgi:crossover junction endodeoxyribonuclease RuvC
MPRVLAIDPGSHLTGWAVVDGDARKHRLVGSGTIRLDEAQRLGDRLAVLHEELLKIIHEHRPTEGAIERVFVARNADSALKLGHVRGIALLATHQAGLRAHEYAPAQVKKTVTGSGRAEKFQMVAMIRMLLGMDRDPAVDEADAIAIAVTHLMLAGERNLFEEALAKAGGSRKAGVGSRTEGKG